ncbi:hypothetical protein CBS63078_11110 [Aspergillus niger]|nr:hypothetical protein CBS133816_1991 [Aspergillus niger]KAI2885814.1 hypothetical protein CBS63078_11110 [Aspergillus niger]KAI2975245.1 hypothetical protein CBS147323_1115 [Aspergillus niger]KAI3034548.1 hypothetical protein CBS147347_84 [Aspergillus niger]KAI3070155.1 hypothetical protein CBS147353_6871 [Aspergillus niger]
MPKTTATYHEPAPAPPAPAPPAPAPAPPARPGLPYRPRPSGPAAAAHHRTPAASATPAEPRGPSRAQLERSKIVDALEDAGVSVPEGVLPPSRELTPAQHLRKKELRDELAMRQEAEKLKRSIVQEKEEMWAARKLWHEEQMKACLEAMEEDLVPARKDVDEEDVSIKKVVKELKSLV